MKYQLWLLIFIKYLYGTITFIITITFIGWLLLLQLNAYDLFDYLDDKIDSLKMKIHKGE